MSKPLELIVYSKCEQDLCTITAPHYDHPSVYMTMTELPQLKRLSDAELAAEYWRAYILTISAGLRQSGRSKAHAQKVALTLHRFATLPHYDEATV